MPFTQNNFPLSLPCQGLLRLIFPDQAEWISLFKRLGYLNIYFYLFGFICLGLCRRLQNVINTPGSNWLFGFYYVSFSWLNCSLLLSLWIGQLILMKCPSPTIYLGINLAFFTHTQVCIIWQTKKQGKEKLGSTQNWKIPLSGELSCNKSIYQFIFGLHM